MTKLLCENMVIGYDQEFPTDFSPRVHSWTLKVKDDSGQMKVATFKPGRLIVPNYQACTSVRCRENESSRDGHVYHNTMF